MLALLLAVVISVSAFPLSAFAAEINTEETSVVSQIETEASEAKTDVSEETLQIAEKVEESKQPVEETEEETGGKGLVSENSEESAQQTESEAQPNEETESTQPEEPQAEKETTEPSPEVSNKPSEEKKEESQVSSEKTETSQAETEKSEQDKQPEKTVDEKETKEVAQTVAEFLAKPFAITPRVSVIGPGSIDFSNVTVTPTGITVSGSFTYPTNDVQSIYLRVGPPGSNPGAATGWLDGGHYPVSGNTFTVSSIPLTPGVDYDYQVVLYGKANVGGQVGSQNLTLTTPIFITTPPNNVTVKEEYKLPDGSEITTVPPITLAYGAGYSKTAPDFPGYTYLHCYVAGTGPHTTNVAGMGSVTADATVTFVYSPNPTVTTGGATVHSPVSATITGSYNPYWVGVPTKYFEYGVAPGSYTSGAVGDAQNLTLNNLTPATTYYYRAVIITAAGVPYYGAEGNFTTFANPNVTVNYLDANTGAPVKAADVVPITYNTNFNTGTPAITGYTYVGNKINTTAGAANPNAQLISNIISDQTVYHYYYRDTANITVKHLNVDGTPAAADVGPVVVNNNTAYQTLAESVPGKAVLRVTTTVTRATAVGPTEVVNAAGGKITDWTVTPTLGDYEIEVVYYYDRDTTGNGIPDYDVTINYVDLDGNSIADSNGNTSEIVAVDYTQSHTVVAPKIDKHILTEWTKDGGAINTTLPAVVTNVTAAVTVNLIYAQDANNDGSEDVTFNVTHSVINGPNAGTKIGTDRAVTYEIGDRFRDADAIIHGYTYNGTYLDQNGVQQTGTPNFAVQRSDRKKDIVYQYTANAHVIEVFLIDRDGNSMANGTRDSRIAVVFGENFVPSTPSFPGYVFADWQVGANGTPEGNNSPNVLIPDNDVVLYLIYGEDQDGNGVEDFDMVVKHQSSKNGNAIGTDIALRPNVGDAINITDTAITGYTYDGEYIDQDGNVQQGLPSFTAEVLRDRNKEIILLYTPNTYKINVYAVDRNYNSINSGAHDELQVEIDFDEIFTATAPSIRDYVFVDWQIDLAGSLEGNTNPSFLMDYAQDLDVYLVYGQDLNNNGKEDVTFTVKHEKLNGQGSPASIGTDRDVTVDIGDVFNETADAIHGYTSNGTYRDQSGAQQTGDPNFTVALSDMGADIVYEYTANGHTIDVFVIDRDGNSIGSGIYDSLSNAVLFDDSFTALTPSITGYVFVDWHIELTGSLENNTNPTITVPDNNVELYLVYGEDKDGNSVEDFEMTITHKSTKTGNNIGTDRVVRYNVGENFNEADDAIVGYTYSGEYVDQNGNVQQGIPNFTVNWTDRHCELTYLYTPNTYEINVYVVDRNGNAIDAGAYDELQIPFDFDDTFTATVPSIIDYVFVDWKIDAAGALEGNTNPSFLMDMPNNVDVYLVYGQDLNNDGKEDVTFTVKYQKLDGTQIAEDKDFTINIGDVFDELPKGIIGYTSAGQYIDQDGNVQNGNPNFVVALADMGKEIVYQYTANPHTIDVYHVDRKGNSIDNGAHDTTMTVDFGDEFTFVPATTIAPDYLLVDWKLSVKDEAEGDLTPKFTLNYDEDFAVYIIYGRDRDNNGVEDFEISLNWEMEDGTVVAGMNPAVHTDYVNKGDYFTGKYNEYLTVPAGVNYEGFKVDGGSLVTGDPNVLINNDMVVTYVHSQIKHTVTIKTVNESGKEIAETTTQTVNYGESVEAETKKITGYEFQSWKLNDEVKSGKPNVASVEADIIITLVYKTSVSGGHSSKDNYEFVKLPDVKSVSPGQLVNYTFSGFANKWETGLEKYTIIDKPDKGLDFVSAKLPAFTNGNGVTYKVIYNTNKGGIKDYVLADNIDAGKEYTVKAPTLANGEYITMISIEFGAVPAGFAAGDTFTMSFRVWDNPPAGRLTNIGILRYWVNGESKEFASSAEGGTINISGWFTTPQTGDNQSVAVWLSVAVMSSALIFVLALIKKKKKA